jgi:tRNA dimethylallyltransferase
VTAHIRGELAYDALLERIRQRTRNYAKRQGAWFRREQGILWLHGFGDDPDMERQVLERSQV